MFTIEFLLRALFTEFSEVRECTFNICGTFYKLSISQGAGLIVDSWWTFLLWWIIFGLLAIEMECCTEISKSQWPCSFLLTLLPVGSTHMVAFRGPFAPSVWFLMGWKCTHNVSELQKNKMQSLQAKKCSSKNLMMSVPTTMLHVTNYNQFIHLVGRTWCP